MDKQTFLTAIFAFAFSTQVYADSNCSQISAMMYGYTQNVPHQQSSSFPAPWQDTPWLLGKLGAATTQPIAQKELFWRHYKYALLIENDVIVGERGKRPERLSQLSTATAQAALATLGRPDLVKQTELTQFHWNCDTGSEITIRVKENGEYPMIANYQGSYCPTKQSHCLAFKNDNPHFVDYDHIGSSFQKASLYLKHPILNNVFSPEEAGAIALIASEKAAKTAFSTSVTSFAQLQAIAMVHNVEAYQKIKMCVPGGYRLLLPFVLGGQEISPKVVAPFFFIVNAKVQGFGPAMKCSVEYTLNILNNSYTLNCLYDNHQLQSLTATQATLDADYRENNLKASNALWQPCSFVTDASL